MDALLKTIGGDFIAKGFGFMLRQDLLLRRR